MQQELLDVPDRHSPLSSSPHGLSSAARGLVLTTAFTGWLLAGMQMGLTLLAMRSAIIDLQHVSDESVLARWFAWFSCAILFGAAAGGLLFGWAGDRFGRSKAMAYSVMCFSIFSGVAYFARTPTELLLLRFLAGIGGNAPYARIGAFTSLIFVVGMLAILVAPDTTRKQLED